MRISPFLFFKGRQIFARGSVLLFLVGLALVVTLYREQLQGFAQYGYLGIFVACFAANATVLLPAPSTAVVLTFAAVYQPFWVGVVGGGGAAVGELVGYSLGALGHEPLDLSPVAQRLRHWMERWGVLTVFCIALLPSPFFDVVGLTAGGLKMPLAQFFGAVLAGKILKMLAYAFLGAQAFVFLEPYLTQLLPR